MHHLQEIRKLCGSKFSEERGKPVTLAHVHLWLQEYPQPARVRRRVRYNGRDQSELCTGTLGCKQPRQPGSCRQCHDVALAAVLETAPSPRRLLWDADSRLCWTQGAESCVHLIWASHLALQFPSGRTEPGRWGSHPLLLPRSPSPRGAGRWCRRAPCSGAEQRCGHRGRTGALKRSASPHLPVPMPPATTKARNEALEYRNMPQLFCMKSLFSGLQGRGE